MVRALAPHRARILLIILAILALTWLPYAPFRDSAPTLHDFNPQIWSERAQDRTSGADGGCCYAP